MRTALLIALAVFFGWFIVDTLASLAGRPLEGVFYPMASGWLKSMPNDWTQKAWFGAPLYLAVFGAVWFFFVRREGMRKGLRLAALTTAFTMVPFWVVSAVSAEMYGLELNGWWLGSMACANLVFLLYGFIGDGNTRDLYF